MFYFMSCFCKFVSFVIANDVRVGSNFVYGKGVSPLL